MNAQLNKLLHNKTLRDGGLYSLFSFFNRGVSFVLLTILAKFIGPQEYGQLSMYNTLVMLLGYFVGMNSAGYLSISFFRNPKEEFNKDVTTIILITFLFSSFFLLLFLSTSQWLSTVLQVSVPLLFIGLIVSFADVFTQLNLDYLRVQEKISWYGILSCSFALINFTLSLFLVVEHGDGWKGRVYAQLVCDLFFAIIAFVWFFRDKLYSLPGSISRYKKILLWSVPLIPHSITIWMKQGLDRYIISNSHSMSDVGLFSFALTLASVVSMIGFAFNQTNSVNLYQTLSDNTLTNEYKFKSLKKKETFFTIAYVAATFIVLVVGIVAIHYVMPRYISAIPYFIILVFYGLSQCIYYLHCNYLFFYDKTKQIMLITFSMALIHVLLSYLLTRYSLYFTCAVNVVSQSLVTALVIWESKKVIKEKL